MGNNEEIRMLKKWELAYIAGFLGRESYKNAISDLNQGVENPRLPIDDGRQM